MAPADPRADGSWRFSIRLTGFGDEDQCYDPMAKCYYLGR